MTSEAEHGEGYERLRGVEPEGSTGKEPDASIDRLDERVREAVLEGDEDGVNVVGDGVAEAHEGVDTGTPGPLHPLLQEFDRLHEGELEYEAEVLLEQMGAEQRLVDALDPDQLAFLAWGEVLGILPERVAASLELPGVSEITSPASVVPDFPSDLVESLGCPATA